MALVAPDAGAQEVLLRGEVKDSGGLFTLDCTNAELTSASEDLDAFRGKHVEIQGSWNGSPHAPLVDVTSIVEVPQTFDLGGNSKLGGDLHFEIQGSSGDVAVVFAAIAPGFAPTRAAGTFLLDPSFLLLAALGTVDADGRLEVTVLIQDNDVYLDLDLFFQAALLFEAGGSLWVNPQCTTLTR